MNILIKNVDIITSIKSRPVIRDGIIAISGQNIEFVGSLEDVPGEFDLDNFFPDRLIDARGKIAMPGLVNTHTHCAMTILRNFAGDLSLSDWLFKNIIPAEAKLTAEDVYWGTMLGIAEMIKSGTTSFADMYIFMNEVGTAVEESGIRATLSKSPMILSTNTNDRSGTFEYFNRWHNSADGRMKVYIEIHSVYMFNEGTLRMASQLAKELGTGIMTHISETEYENIETIKKYGMTPTELFFNCGVFDVPVNAAHCVHLTDNDIAIMKSKGVNISHNPTSNLKLGSGIARIPYILENGINVALGTDGAASNNNLNMFEEMNLAALIHKGILMNPLLVDAGQAVLMATVNGAKTIGCENETGCLAKGMKADLILLDTKEPHFNPITDPLSAVVYSAQASDVHTVIVDGKILMENRELKTIDVERAIWKVNEAAKRIIT